MNTLQHINIIKFIYSKIGSIGKTWQLFRRSFIHNGWNPTKSIWYNYSADYLFEKWNEKPLTERKITIITMPHTKFVATLISNILNQYNINHSIEVVFEKQNFNDDLHIVICPQAYHKLPNLFIAFQMEQTVSERWFNSANMRKLEKALLILDYSIENIKNLSKKISTSKLYYQPIGCTLLKKEKQQDLLEYKYDIIFYGDTNNQRRKLYIEEISKKYNIKIINNLFGEEMWKELSQARIVLNIHYYENALLETTRLYECLSNHTLIISEKSSDIGQYPDLQKLVDFCEVGNINQMLEKIDYWLTNPVAFKQRKKEIELFSINQKNDSFFFFSRFLLAIDLIDFETCYQNTKDIWQPTYNFWCLGLPESVERADEFLSEKAKYPHIFKFPGLRHRISWIGCGLSYKYITRYALDHNYPHLTVCEDDVLFPQNFEYQYQNITNYLKNSHISWDIFSGHLTDLHPNAEAKIIHHIDQYQVIKTDYCTGMVFNIYHPKILKSISEWENTNIDLENNAIDRYIDSLDHLEVITTPPFFVKHKEYIKTTLWDKSDYNEMVSNSERNLKALSEINNNTTIE